jgi:hypothetical protein
MPIFVFAKAVLAQYLFEEKSKKKSMNLIAENFVFERVLPILLDLMHNGGSSRPP